MGAGLATATEAAVAAWQDPRQSSDQPSLFGVDPVEPGGVGEIAETAERRGPGRPPGARNRSTDEWTRYLLSRYRSPLVVLAELAQAHPQRLAEELSQGEIAENRVTAAEATRLIVQAATALAPYLHQRQPQAVDTGGAGMLVVQIGDLGTQQGDAGVTIVPAEEVQQNQDVDDTSESRTE